MKNNKRKRRNTATTFLFCLPFLVVFLIFFLYPFIKGIFMSLTDWNGLNFDYDIVGLKNYKKVIEDEHFWDSMKVTLIFTLFSVVFGNVFGLLLAVVVEKMGKLKGFFRTAFFVPFIFSTSVIGLIWNLILTKVLPALSASASILGFLDIDYLGKGTNALISVIVMNIWYATGYFMILYISGLQSIDQGYYEAAKIDGAGNVQQFFSITVPLLLPTISVCIFLAISTSVKAFDIIYVLTGGGPGHSTEVMAINIYNEAFGGSLNYGYAMAKAMVMAGVIILLTVVQRKVFAKLEGEAS